MTKHLFIYNAQRKKLCDLVDRTQFAVRNDDLKTYLNQISELTNVSKEYIKILLKITGITFICEITSDICKDCGYVAISNQVQIFGKISILVISLPIFSELILQIGKMLS